MDFYILSGKPFFRGPDAEIKIVPSVPALVLALASLSGEPDGLFPG
jgi:hypothetical protein